MRGQLGEITRQYPLLKDSTDAAKKSSDTADASFKAAADNFRTAQRAWVGIRSLAPLTPAVGIGKFSIAANVSNVGLTPATHLHSAIGMNAAVCPDKFLPKTIPYPASNWQSNGLLMPNSPQTTAASTIFITQTAMDKLRILHLWQAYLLRHLWHFALSSFLFQMES
jgi:hypothetical protein